MTPSPTGRQAAKGCGVTRQDFDCEQAIARLFDFTDKQLDGEDHEAMQRHLCVCPACLARATFESRLKDKLLELREDRAPDVGKERIRRLLQGLE